MSDATVMQELHTDLAFHEGLLENLFNAVIFSTRKRQITFWNRAAEELTGYTRAQMIGKSCCEETLLHLDPEGKHVCSGWQLAAQTLQDGMIRETDVYVRHRQGFLTPVRMRVAPVTDRVGKIVGVVEILDQTRQSAEDMQTKLQPTFIDPLTELATTHYLEMRLHSRHEELSRFGWSYGVLRAGIDGYKRMFRQWGPSLADRMSIVAGKTLANCLRSFDVVGVWDKGEFLAIVPVLCAGDLYSVGERVRSLLKSCCVRAPQGSISCEVSVGAAFADVRDEAMQVVTRAGVMMNKSRRGGGDKVSL